MLAASRNVKNICTPASLLNIKIYKRNVKKEILDIQSNGSEEWSEENFLLHCISGLRLSNRINDRDCTLYSLENPPST